MSDPPPERAQRGLKGITKLGARTVRNGAFLLEQRYGVGHLTFLTCTLPSLDETAEYEVGREWAEIIRIFNQGLTRLLTSAGLPPSYVGCTEIQEKRYRERGGLPLHLHMVFPGRRRFGGWAISCDQYRALWRRAVIARCPRYESCLWRASVDAEQVRSSAEGYLGKYMTKGAASLSSIVADDPGMSEFLPRSWWCCSMNVRRAIGKRITGGLATASALIRDVRGKDSRVGFSAEVEVPMKDGNRVVVAVVGKLTAEGRNKYCWREGRIPTILN